MKKEAVRENPLYEVQDDHVVEWPVGLRVPESLEQKMARMIRTSVSQAARNNGAETFEESDDFDVEDDPDLPPGSVHELDDDQERIMRDQKMVRRIPKEFRDAFEREVARRRLEDRIGVEKSTKEVKQEPAEAGKVAPS